MTYGRIGDGGANTVKEHESAAAASKFADKMIAEKLKKGYVPDTAASTAAVASAAPAAAVAPAAPAAARICTSCNTAPAEFEYQEFHCGVNYLLKGIDRIDEDENVSPTEVSLFQYESEKSEYDEDYVCLECLKEKTADEICSTVNVAERIAAESKKKKKPEIKKFDKLPNIEYANNPGAVCNTCGENPAVMHSTRDYFSQYVSIANKHQVWFQTVHDCFSEEGSLCWECFAKCEGVDGPEDVLRMYNNNRQIFGH